MTTIEDVAKAAGVSRSTVSYALSGKRTISADTRQRIAEAIETLGFTVNAGARALATSQSMVLGLHLQFQDDEFAPAMLQYVLPVTEHARELGYDILMMTEPDGPSAIRRVSKSNMVDGLILLDVVDPDPRITTLRESIQPGVLIGFPSQTGDVYAVDLDFEEAARTLIDRFRDAGHRELLLVTPPEDVARRGGTYGIRFRDAALRRSASVGIELTVVPGEASQPGIDASLRAALASVPSATGLIVHNDASIVALPGLLKDLEISVPQDLSVASLYSGEYARAFSLPYSSIDTSPGRLGRLAVHQLVRLITAPLEAGAPGTRFIHADFVDRGTIGEPRED